MFYIYICNTIVHCSVSSAVSPFPYIFIHRDLTGLGRSPTEATRLRFDQERSRLHLIHGESSSHRGRAGGRSAITK
jgi:hypothetical protein